MSFLELSGLLGSVSRNNLLAWQTTVGGLDGVCTAGQILPVLIRIE